MQELRELQAAEMAELRAMFKQATQGPSPTPAVTSRGPARGPGRASARVSAPVVAPVAASVAAPVVAPVAAPVAAPLAAPSAAPATSPLAPVQVPPLATLAPPSLGSESIPSLVKDMCAEMRAAIRHAVQDQIVGMRHQLLTSPGHPDVYSSVPSMTLPYPMAQPVQHKQLMMMMPRRQRTYHSPAFDGANPGYGFNSIDYDWT